MTLSTKRKALSTDEKVGLVRNIEEKPKRKRVDFARELCLPLSKRNFEKTLFDRTNRNVGRNSRVEQLPYSYRCGLNPPAMGAVSVHSRRKAE